MENKKHNRAFQNLQDNDALQIIKSQNWTPEKAEVFNKMKVHTGETFEQLLNDHLEFTTKTFPKGTADGALIHLGREIEEVRAELPTDTFDKAIEFADCLGCLVDAANRSGVPPKLLFDAFGHKLQINKARQWKDNGDGSHSHIKLTPQTNK